MKEDEQDEMRVIKVIKKFRHSRQGEFREEDG